MKKLLFLCFLIAAFCAVPAYAEGSISVFIDSNQMEFSDAAPQVINDRAMVPMRSIFEKLGADVHWDETNQSIKATKGEKEISLKIDNTNAKVGGKDVTLDAPPLLLSDRTFVPLRFVSEALDAKVYWNDQTNSAYVYSKPYLWYMDAPKLETIIQSIYRENIDTSFGTIENHNYVIQPLPKDGLAFDLFVTSVVNIDQVNDILNSDTYNFEQKEKFKHELKKYVETIGRLTLDVTSNSKKIAGSFIIISGYQNNDKSKPIYNTLYNWANINRADFSKSDMGFMWILAFDDYSF